MPSPVNRIDPSECAGAARARLGFWLRNDAARLLWPARCLACGDPGGDGIDLCAACAMQLPWNASACLRCAIPLPRTESPGGDDVRICGACLPGAAGALPLTEVHAACVYARPGDRLLLRFK